ncbi:hypothetical protein F9Z36_1272 [Neisseria gonorrhoeae]|nr:hypothetical protein F9Z36_1272 [Neisseria gonorrhoeae]
MPSEGSDGIGIGESEAVAHAQRGFVGFEAGVFQASPIVVAVAGVQGQLGRDVETDAGDDAETHAADAVAFLMGVLRLWTNIISCRFCGNTIEGGKNLCCFFGRIDAVSDVSVGDARTDIGFEFIVEFEIVNGGQTERGDGVERTVFLIFRLQVYPVAMGFLHPFYVDGIFIVVPFSVTGVICRYPPAAEVVADRHPGVDGMRTDVSEIIAYRAYCAFFCTGWFRIIVGNAFGGVG